MKKNPKISNFLILTIFFSAFFIGFISYTNMLAINSPYSKSNKELLNPFSAETVPTNLTIRIWLKFDSRTPTDLNGTEGLLWVDLEKEEQQYIFIFVQVLNSNNSIITDLDASLRGSVFHSTQTDLGVQKNHLFDFPLYWDSSDNMFKTNISLLYTSGSQIKQLESNNIIEINVESKNPIYQNVKGYSNIFVSKAPSELPSWFYLVAIGTILFWSTVIILIIRYFRRSHRTVEKKITDTRKRLKELNRKMIELDKEINREELIKEHEEIIRKLEDLSHNSNLIDESQENQSTSIERSYMKNDLKLDR